MENSRLWKNLLPIVGLVCIFTCVGIYGHIKSDEFYNAKIDSKIIGRCWFWGRKSGVIMENDFSFDTNTYGKFEIGDSIHKLEKSYEISLYRKDIKGKYILQRYVDFR